MDSFIIINIIASLVFVYLRLHLDSAIECVFAVLSGITGLGFAGGIINILSSNSIIQWIWYLFVTYASMCIGIYFLRKKKIEKILKNTNEKRDTPNYDDFADNVAGDGFGFEAGRFGAKPPPPQADENAPRGYEKRHPDDAKLWAFVDDPEASDGERRNAMDMILKRQAARRGGNGGGGRGAVKQR